ncbi:MAG TPA: cob(I)yrinic acid a,c-diamide adenosyltransferase [Papillibacter sp.]|jgi:cob(I)alamin adenosyltransferase|nr:cob(I)yrinic acid a,c-diamide adenosyltransferase [Papillibacter sp.]
MAQGLVHVYYGYGKGKTTAALGLCLRACGSGKKAVIVQFLKDTPSGEIKSLSCLENVTLLRGKAGGMFVSDMTEEQKEETRRIHNENLQKALDLVTQGECCLLVLDEAMDALQLDVLDAALVRNLLENKPPELEVVITGHKPIHWVMDKADYITEMVKVRHPFDKGIPARKGIEF